MSTNNLFTVASWQNQKVERLFWLLSFSFLFIAYLTHLGHIPLDLETDESRRALVSLEMMLSKNYLTPTLNGEPFLNKPPLYNWLVIAYVKLTGTFSMFAFRLPVIVSLACMTYVVYYFTRKFTHSSIAFLTAFAFCSNGRILIYDSIQGLIDTTFSLIVYLNFMAIFWYGSKNKYTQLFIVSYLLTAIGFLTKGLPMLVFQAITLFTWLLIQKDLKKIFHRAHLLGIAIFLAITVTYYIAYFSVSSTTPQSVFLTLINESTKRTGIEQGSLNTIIHLLTFPFWFLFHFAPWTIFIIVLFQKNLFSKIKENRFVYYSACIFLTNISVYWLSPQVYPRYMFMFLPLSFSVLFYIYFNHCIGKWQTRFLPFTFLIICGLLTLACIIVPFLKVTHSISYSGLKAGILALLLLVTFLVALYNRNSRIYAFVAAIVIFRFGFNLFVVEQRGSRSRIRQSIADNIVEITRGQNLYLLRDAAVGYFDGMSFHISKGRNEVLKFKNEPVPGEFYIADVHQLRNREYKSYMQFNTYLSDTLHLVQFPQ